MRIGLVVDSACDLPQEYLEREQISLLPISIRIGEAVQVDRRDPRATLDFLHRHVVERGAYADTAPFSTPDIQDLFLRQLVLDYDFVFCLTINRHRSEIFNNATKASFAILKDYKPIRTAAGLNSPFSLRVIDTQNLFAAQGIVAVAAARMRTAGLNPGQMRTQLEQLALHTYGYLIPRNLNYIRERGKYKNDRSVGLIAAALGTAIDIKPVLRGFRGETGPVAKIRGFDSATKRLFEFTAQRIEHGLLVPAVCMSYGGDLDEMRSLPGYMRLSNACRSHGVELLESIMSLTGMVNVGKGSLVVGFAAEPHQFA